ncbi:hypothetical protein CK203_026615 [Vitis vinifera]|uniref:Reverse transcriptase Ty1/copia-type domain-containing protein n=1 Tax=Vitis vinifera TaxID=29760 RepID=A0A438ITN9_VITVI|nr:hypothetical protein CK203_026615 [Vitis vinifera]
MSTKGETVIQRMEEPTLQQGHESVPRTDLISPLEKGVRSCTRHPMSNLVSNKNLSSSMIAFSSQLFSIEISNNIQDALEIREWKEPLQQLDVKTVFLNGDLKEKVHLDLPPGFDKRVGSKSQRRKPNFFRFSRVINSGEPSSDRVSLRSPHFLPNHSGQPHRRRISTTPATFSGELSGELSGDVFFQHRPHQEERLEEISNFFKSSEPENPPRAGHAHFSGRLNLTRRRVRPFPATRLLLQPRLTPTSIPTYLVLPSEPCTYLFWGFLSPSALQTAFPAKFRLLFLHPNPCTCLGKCSSTFWWYHVAI